MEGELQLAALDHNVGEVKEVDLQWIQHALPRDNDLLWLLLHWKGTDQGSHLFGCLPLGQLKKTRGQSRGLVKEVEIWKGGGHRRVVVGGTSMPEQALSQQYCTLQ